MMKPRSPRKRPLIQWSPTAFFEQRRIHKHSQMEFHYVRWNYKYWARSNRLYPRSHPLPYSQRVQRSNHYLLRIHHLIGIRDLRLLLQDLSRIRLNRRLRTCCEAIGINFAAHERSRPKRSKQAFLVLNVPALVVKKIKFLKTHCTGF